MSTFLFKLHYSSKILLKARAFVAIMTLQQNTFHFNTYLLFGIFVFYSGCQNSTFKLIKKLSNKQLAYYSIQQIVTSITISPMVIWCILILVLIFVTLLFCSLYIIQSF